MKRNNKIDFARGLMIFIIFINHISIYFDYISTPSRYTLQYFGYTSAAEFLIVISAYSILLSSSNAGGDILDLKTILNLTIKRFYKLYKAHFLTLIFISILTIYLRTPAFGMSINENFRHIKILLFGCLLLFQPALLDILPMYLALTVITPIVLYFFKYKKVHYVLLFSFLLWALAQSILVFGKRKYIGGIVTPGFNILAWQIIYILSLYFFYSRKKIMEYKYFIFSLSLILIIVLFLANKDIMDLNINISMLTNRKNMGALRVLNLISLVAFVSIFPSLISYRLEKIIPSIISNFFIWIGKNSLNLYIIHIVLFYFLGFYAKFCISDLPVLRQYFLLYIFIILPLLILPILQFIKNKCTR